MDVEDLIDRFPKKCRLRDGTPVVLRPLKASDEQQFHHFFCAVPETERLLFKDRVTDPKVIRQWCKKIDYGHILPLLALHGRKVVADASLHQQLGGWRRHIGQIRMVVHPEYRGRGLAHLLVRELIDVARDLGLEKLEAEFMAEQGAARHVFAELGFTELLSLRDYVKDMQAITHGYVLMGRHIITDEEYAGAN
ncbi:GNAT family N-acetyltransferase [bacterium]|nr:GNAT family N-acetyltransferase [bacterium]